ncbi:MAG TPA: sigma-70 family RNA polymerase sigma factor [Chloroflexi bacterium]|nr:sigma-70 family RNA polymerase sigma factor [Chloroflexota bacterium]
MNRLSDETALIRRAQQGDRAALAALHDQYYRAIYTYFATRLDVPQVAEDLTSEVFVRMVQKISKFRQTGRPLLAWLYTIARNLLTDYHRESRQNNAPLSLEEHLVAGTDNPARSAENSMAVDCLRKALEYITEEQRLVVVGKFLEGRPTREVARLLGKTEGAVKALQHRALAALRRAIEQEGCYEP